MIDHPPLGSRLLRRRRPPPGSAPGTFVVSGEAQPPRSHLIRYDAESCEERSDASLDDIRELRDGKGVLWVDVEGLGSEQTIREIARLFDLHPLAIEDIVHVPQRPKAEHYDEFLFLVSRPARTDATTNSLAFDQTSIFVGAGWLISFRERDDDGFARIRERIRDQGSIRGEGADFLAYALLDAIVDSYYPALEKLGDRIVLLEEEALEAANSDVLRNSNRIRHELLSARRTLWPQRDAIRRLIVDEGPLIGENVRLHLRDVHDHCAQTADLVESYREIVSSAANTHLSVVSNRMNEAMKVLTVMAGLFIPLSFLAGLYGMNFDYMPELHQRYGYPVVLAVMGGVAAGLLFYFRRRGWL